VPLGAHSFDTEAKGRARRFGLACVCVFGVWYLLRCLSQKWIPHDEGALAQAAERVLDGQLPHRDFAELYTGGLSFFDALAFRVLGINLLALRYAMLPFYAGWVAATYYCASRLVSPLSAFVVTALAVVWTVPNYPAAMPSWYNLFFATYGAAALLRFMETGGRRWLVAAGVMGGFSMLIKVTGLYYVVACLLWLVAHEALGRPAVTHPGGRAYRAVLAVALVGLVLATACLVRRPPLYEHFYHFVLPVAAIAAATYRGVAAAEDAPFRLAIKRLGWLAGPFLGGVLLPVALYVGWYGILGCLGALLHGVFVSPATRLVSAAMPPMEWTGLFPAAFMAIAFALAVRMGRGRGGWVVTALWLTWLLALAAGSFNYLYVVTWASVSQAIPLVVGAGAMVWVRRVGAPTGREGLERCFPFVALAALWSLVQFPFTAPIYFCYAAPMALLALVGLLQVVDPAARPLAPALALYYGAFAVLVLNPQSIKDLGFRASAPEASLRLDLPRGGLRISADDARTYEEVVPLLQSHARGRFTYAGPDAPEVYFLAGLRNPGRALFEFVESVPMLPDVMSRVLDSRGITAIAINLKPAFSTSLTPDVEAVLAARFPGVKRAGKFEVRWRE